MVIAGILNIGGKNGTAKIKTGLLFANRYNTNGGAKHG
jgi:hypothetical protein